MLHIFNTKGKLFDNKKYIEYNDCMKNVLLLDKINDALAINWTICLMFCSLIIYRNQISDCIDKGANILNYTFKNFASFVVMLTITVCGALSYIGQCGGSSVCNYAINHIYPALFFMFIQFANFILMVFNYFLRSQSRGQRRLDIKVWLKSQSSTEYISIFKKPSLALLQ